MIILNVSIASFYWNDAQAIDLQGHTRDLSTSFCNEDNDCAKKQPWWRVMGTFPMSSFVEIHLRVKQFGSSLGLK